MKKLTLALAVTVASATPLFLSGCGSPAVPRDLMAEEARSDHGGERPVAMRGDGTFQDGDLHVVATVARGFHRGGKGSKPGTAPRERKGWFKHDTEAFSESYSFDYGDSDEEQKEAIQEYIRQAMARRAAGSPMPPVTLQITFENKSTHPIEIAPTDANSDLGNFAVFPKKLTIAPGEKASLDPMVSQLGVTNDEIPLTVGIRVGGKSETKVILVKNILSPELRQQAEAATAAKH